MTQKAQECEQIKQLILRQQLEGLTKEEVINLNTHLEICSDCRLLQKKINELPDLLDVPDGVKPFPRPEILQNLLKRVGVPGSLKHTVSTSFPDFLLSFLKRPVPLYQTAIAISLAVVISISAFTVFGDSRDHTVSPGQEASLQVNRPDHDTYYYPSPHILPHRVGVNAAEDTSFQSILFTAL